MATEEKIDKLLLQKLGGTGVRFYALLLDLNAIETPPAWIQGYDPLGRGIVLIGDEGLGAGPEKDAIVSMLLQDLASGNYPEMVCPIAFAAMASRAIVDAVSGTTEEVLLHGPRGTGKTIVEAGIALVLAKHHLAAGYAGPFRILWVHDSLLSASVKTARSLEQPMWAGCWTLHDDRRTARFTLGGRQLIAVDFVGAADEASAQRLRASAHHVIVEELIPSLTDGVGILEEQYDLALSSMLRQDVQTPRRVAVSSTNPGAPDSWPYRRFMSGNRPTATAIRIPREDRLTTEEQDALDRSFSSNPTLQRRLARGEWVMLEQGAAVAEGFDVAVHVARAKLTPHPNYLLAIGWDGGHSPSAVIGQNHMGQCQIYAGLNLLQAGTLELIERQVLPWLHTYAPFALQDYGASLVHIIDPNMETAGQATYLESSAKMIRKHLGGRIIKGPVRWAPRREAILKALRPAHVGGRVPLQISPDEETTLLIHALEGRWFYPTRGTQVDRTGPEKPNSPWADLGDASAYLLDWLLGGELMESAPRDMKVEYGLEWSAVRTETYSV